MLYNKSKIKNGRRNTHMELELIKKEDYFYLREGMVLRKKHILEIFKSDLIDLAHPDLVTSNSQSGFRGTKKLRSQVSFEYEPVMFIMAAPDIYKMYKEGEPLVASVLNELPKLHGNTQIYHAFTSGILKHDTRSYYYDPEGIRYLKIHELKLERGEA